MSDLTVSELETLLIEEGRALQAKREIAEKIAAEYKTAKEAWENSNADLIEADKTYRSEVEKAESSLRQKMMDYHRLSGSKKFQGAYEIRMTPTPEYDPAKLLLWLLDAPRQLAADLLTIDKKKVDTWIKEKAGEGGAVPAIPYCAPVPALIIEKPSAAILSKGLASLEAPKPIVVATSNMVTISVVTNPEAVLTSPENAVPKTTMGYNANMAKNVPDVIGGTFESDNEIPF